MDPVLQVDNLVKAFGGKRVVDDISFSVNEGEILGLLGPNGAGKTTAIRIIMGILKADGGEALFSANGRQGSLDKAEIGYLPEERGLYDDARVVDILVYLAGLKGKPAGQARREALSWLERLELGEYGSQRLDKLSKGMQQKVQFVASVLHRPRLVMLDEPFSGLDPINQDVFKDIVRELQQEGRAILLSAHQMNMVEELCDSIFLIHRGQRVLYGDLSRIKDEFQEHIVDIHHHEDDDQSFLRRMSGIEMTRTEPGRLRFRYSGTGEISGFLSGISQNFRVREISARKPPLHDIFISTVREQGKGASYNEEG